MQYPTRFDGLLGYPFPRLRALQEGTPPGGDVVRLSIGEPKHPYPSWLNDEINRFDYLYNSYPINNGYPEWQEAVLGFLKRRFVLDLEEANITPLNGTREGLYNSALALFPEKKNGKTPKVLVPNPFYQVYMMGAKTLGLGVEFINCTAEHNFLPQYHELDTATLDACCAVFLCSPSNPQGAVADREYLERLVQLAERHDFMIFADECYSEIYFTSPPLSALQVAKEQGADINRVVSFQSLSKRSNVPGLRSGFAASGKETMRRIRELRGYAGAPIPGPIQMASAALWNDEEHVTLNRGLYAEKVNDAVEILGEAIRPDGGFFLWLPVENAEKFTLELWKHTGIEVLPGTYLGADTKTGNPGDGYIRIALVAQRDITKQAISKIAEFQDSQRGAANGTGIL